jgi:hypothetical protein
MNFQMFRNSLSCLMVVLLPLSLLAAEPGAMVYVSGSTSVNGTLVPHSSAVLPGDVVRTTSASQANLTTAGVSVTIFQNSALRFEGNGLSLEDGSVNIGTAKRGMGTRAGIITVTPASEGWTEFEMSHRNGAVQIVAKKGNVNVSSGAETVLLAQGQSETRDDSATTADSDNQKNRKKGGDEPNPAVSTPVIDSPILIGLGAAGIAGGLIYVLTRDNSPVSPVIP